MQVILEGKSQEAQSLQQHLRILLCFIVLSSISVSNRDLY